MPNDTITLSKINALFNTYSKTDASVALLCAKVIREKAVDVNNKLYLAQANLIL